MKKLTTSQKQIIEQITLEFERINQSSVPNKKYNLLDINPLIEQNRLKTEFIEDANADYKRWEQIANDEAKRIVDLLQEDLHLYSVQKYDHSNGHYDLPTVLIRNSENGSTHPDNCVTFKVCVDKKWKSLYHLNIDLALEFGNNLYYKYSTKRFNTIEGLIKDNAFQRELRDKVIRY